MSDESPIGGLRGGILREVFATVTFEQAVGLVGVLYEYRIVLSKTFTTLLKNHHVDIDLEPLEPHAAALLVSQLFRHDCDQLFLAFTNDWAKLRDSPRTKGLLAAIEGHQYVDRLEPWEAV